jgi:hypothetical protein
MNLANVEEVELGQNTEQLLGAVILGMNGNEGVDNIPVELEVMTEARLWCHDRCVDQTVCGFAPSQNDKELYAYQDSRKNLFGKRHSNKLGEEKTFD